MTIDSAQDRKVAVAVTGREAHGRQVRSDVFEVWPDDRPAERTLLEQIASVVERAGDVVAVADHDRHLTYRELWSSAARIAAGLRAQGVGRGERVLVDQQNSVGWVESFLGILMAGCVAVPIDQRGTDRQRSYVREDSGAVAALGADNRPSSSDEYVEAVTPEDLAVLLYTSGTTGNPKGVMLGHGTLASYRSITASILGRRQYVGAFRNLIAIPLWHSAGCNTQLLPTLALGGTVIIAPGSGPKSILGMVEHWQPDVMFAVPVVYQRLLDATAGDRSVLRCLTDVQFGAAATSKTLIRQLRTALPWVRLGNAFGMTEISNIALFLPDEWVEEAFGSVGFPVPGVECEIREADESGHGLLYLRGPNLAHGYWNRPDLTDDVFGTGWVRSGDVAEIGPEGAIYLRDRVDDVINRGGEKIYSTTVEDALLELSGVTDAAVVPYPDPEMGARVAAVLVSDENYDLDTVRERLQGRLPHNAIPEIVVVTTEPLPRGSSGKVLKSKVDSYFD